MTDTLVVHVFIMKLSKQQYILAFKVTCQVSVYLFQFSCGFEDGNFKVLRKAKKNV